jgi:hypothetical protein
LINAQGHLSVQSPPAFADIAEINQHFGERPAGPTFTQAGTDMVTTIDDYLVESASSTGSAVCQTVTPYHVDWYVQQDNVKTFGLRNFRIDTPELACCTAVGGI